MTMSLLDPIEVWAGVLTVVKRSTEVTTIQLSTDTRDRLYRLKFRRTYDEFLRELCDLYERSHAVARK